MKNDEKKFDSKAFVEIQRLLFGQFVSGKSSTTIHHHSISAILNLVAFPKFLPDQKSSFSAE